MSTYRKIDVEIRNDDISRIINYQKIRKNNVLTEKVFIKNKNGKKVINEIHGVSTDKSDWVIKGEGSKKKYTEYSPEKLFKDIDFINVNEKKIGGYNNNSNMLWFGYIILLIIICLVLLFVYEYVQVSKQIELKNLEKEIWNNRDPKPTIPQELEILNFWKTACKAKSNMWKYFIPAYPL
jgi:hypothetical protein